MKPAPFFGAALVLAASLLVAACSGTGHEAPPSVHTEATDLGELWVRVGDGEPRRVFSEAAGYRPVVSPQARFLAVEVRLLSNLVVVRMLRRQGSEFVATTEDVTRLAWERAALREAFDSHSVERAHTSIVGWGEGDEWIDLKLSGDLPDRREPFESVERVNLSDLGR